MNIDQILQSATQVVQLIQDGTIYYLVLNQADTDDFQFDDDNITKIHKCLDEVESSVGAAVLVTLSTQKKRFSTGFSLEYWAAQIGNSYKVVSRMQGLLGRLLRLNVPTMCAMHGHAYAGGFIFALCHDFRVMFEKSKLCLSEIGLGVTFCPAYNELCKNLMSRQILREMMMGRVINVQEALDRQILSASFVSDSQLEQILQNFVNQFAHQAVYRENIADMKTKLHMRSIIACENIAFSPAESINLAETYKGQSAKL